jgi:Trk-type K+ transport system membrane component
VVITMQKNISGYVESQESKLVPFVYALTRSELLTAHILQMDAREIRALLKKPHIKQEVDSYTLDIDTRIRNNWVALLGLLQSTMVINLLDLMRSSNTDVRIQAIQIAAELVSKYTDVGVSPEILQALQPAE